MAEPTPEQWWAGLDEVDRAAYIHASRTGLMGFQLWLKLADAGVLAWPRAVEDPPWEYRMPGPYLQYVRARAAELNGAAGRSPFAA
jgi:hypothetical protein